MSMFGLRESRLRELVTAVSGRAELSDEAVADRFARAAWSVIAASRATIPPFLDPVDQKWDPI